MLFSFSECSMSSRNEKCILYTIDKDTLLRPFNEITIIWNIAAKVIVKLLINIGKRRRDIDSRLYTEAQAMRLTYIMVGILTEMTHLTFDNGVR